MATIIVRPGSGRRHVGLVRAAGMADHLFGLLYLLLAFRLVLVLVRARVDAGFVRFIDGVTDPFYRPFRGIVPTSTFAGWPIAWSIVFALVAYALLHAIVRALLAWVDRA